MMSATRQMIQGCVTLILGLVAGCCGTPHQTSPAESHAAPAPAHLTSEYFGYENHGDKPTTALRLRMRDGAVQSGALGIFAPEYPGNKEGIEYPLLDIVESAGIISCHVKVVDGDRTRDMAMKLRIMSRDENMILVEWSDVDVGGGVAEKLMLTRAR